MNAGHVLPEPVEYLDIGDEVLVTDGPFGGMRCVLVAERGRTRVAVRFSALRQAVRVELPRDILRPASPREVHRASGLR